MSPTLNISSAGEFTKLLGSSPVVVSDFYADWCGPCKAIAPTYESLSAKYSKPNRITFTKINVDHQQQIAQQYGVRAMPTFMIFRSGSVVETIQGADARRLTTAIENAVKLGGAAKPTFSSVGRTLGGEPRSKKSLDLPWNLKNILDRIICFIGLYIYSLFSFDAYSAAENSPFNLHRTVAASQPNVKLSTRKPASGSESGKKVGTIADITGGN